MFTSEFYFRLAETRGVNRNTTATTGNAKGEASFKKSSYISYPLNHWLSEIQSDNQSKSKWL